MNRISLFVTGITLASFFLGCTPSPEKVCTHYEGLSEKKKKKSDDDDDAKLDKKMEEELKSLCPKMLTAVKEENADAYKCYAKCVTGTDSLDTAKKCDKDCDGFDKAANKAMSKLLKLDDDGDKKKKSSDDEEDKPKKKKSSDDDDTPKKKKKSSDDE